MTESDITRATVTDAEELAAVYRSAYRENRRLGFPAKAESVTEHEVADWIRDADVYVATVDGTIVGGVRLETVNDDRAKLSRLGVHEEWKGKGIGSALLDRAENAARESNSARIRLTTPEEHPYLPDFYRRRGYEKTEPYPLDYREYDEIVMEKRLE